MKLRAFALAGTPLGLGLLITREIVKSHGGEIKVASNERETVFTVRLPRRSGVPE